MIYCEEKKRIPLPMSIYCAYLRKKGAKSSKKRKRKIFARFVEKRKNKDPRQKTLHIMQEKSPPALIQRQKSLLELILPSFFLPTRIYARLAQSIFDSAQKMTIATVKERIYYLYAIHRITSFAKNKKKSAYVI